MQASTLIRLVERESLIRKVEFPRLAVPLAAVLTALMNVGLNLIAVLVFLFNVTVVPAPRPPAVGRSASPSNVPSIAARPSHAN